jgi:pyruvate ferredoxin oxidoreductase gamma subunit
MINYLNKEGGLVAIMKQVTEIRWNARGGQGAVTASKLLAEMALINGMYFQAFPEYGPERMGAPIQCFTRLSAQPIAMYCGVTNPDVVIVVDPTLIGVADIMAGVAENGLVLVNTPLESAEEVKKKLNLTDKQSFAAVDATKISVEELGRPMPNAPMLGAYISISNFMPIEKALSYIESSFSKTFNEKVVMANVKAVRRAFEEVKRI